MLDAIISSLSAIYNVTIFANTFHSWETSLLQLRNGFLPFNIVSWPVLKPILEEIERSVKPSYSLAIDYYDWEKYYILKLITFAVEQEAVYIKLSVPLKKSGYEIKYNLIAPIAFPIPCHSEICNFYTRLGNNSKGLKLKVKDKVWLVSKSDSDLVAEIDLYKFICIPISTKQFCYTFDSNKIVEVDACSRALWLWDEIQVVKNCEFELLQNYRYRPIINTLRNAFSAIIPYFHNCK
jgi:hypothetical protein